MSNRKACRACGEVKDLSEFPAVKKLKGGHRGTCSVCYKENARNWYLRNREHQISLRRVYRDNNVDKLKSAYLKRQYNITLEQYEDLLATQGGVCKICRQPPDDRFLAVDHDHACCPTKSKSCGKCIRGLLCVPCNSGLGNFRDSVNLLSSAATYLTSSPFTI